MSQCVLVVDDDPQIVKLYSRLLTAGGYTVVTENSSKRVIEALDAAAPVDLVILDLSMPPPDGFEVLRILRQNRPGLRILAISGFLDGVLLEAAELLGATASLHKTDAPRLLLETVDRLLGS